MRGRRFAAMSLAITVVLVTAPLYAAEGADQEEVDIDKECQRVRDLQPPPGDQPSMRYTQPGAECDEDYYRTLGNPGAGQGDWARVRACAFRADNEGVLMMLYANGLGVKRDLGLALKYACNSRNDDDAEVLGLIEYRDAEGQSGTRFDVCSFVSAQLPMNICAYLGGVQLEATTDYQLSKLARRLTPAQAAAMAKLRRAAGDFADGVENEAEDIYQKGSMAPMLITGARVAQSREFLEDVVQAEKGEFPEYSAAQFAKLDAKLNQVYRAAMQQSRPPKDSDDEEESSGLLPKTLRDVQRRWLKYRDAWVAYAKLRYPRVPANAWKARLTERRAKQIEQNQNTSW